MRSKADHVVLLMSAGPVPNDKQNRTSLRVIRVAEWRWYRFVFRWNYRFNICLAVLCYFFRKSICVCAMFMRSGLFTRVNFFAKWDFNL